jgi:subtilisin family serine protease
VVEFKSPKGKEYAMELAREILFESQLFNVVAMQIHSKHLEILREDPNIVRVDIDEKVHTIPIFTKEIDESDVDESGGDSRTLQESVPWGIRAVQADRVTMGPNRVKVCIVDTGYDYNHEDLPKNGVTGTDSTRYGGSGRWNADGEGHGTHIAGTIAALGNAKGVRGVIDDGRVLLHIGKGLGKFVPISLLKTINFLSILCLTLDRCIDDNGSGTISNIIEMVEAW